MIQDNKGHQRIELLLSCQVSNSAATSIETIGCSLVPHIRPSRPMMEAGRTMVKKSQDPPRPLLLAGTRSFERIQLPTMCRTNVSYAHPPALNLPFITTVTRLGRDISRRTLVRLAGNISMSPFATRRTPIKEICQMYRRLRSVTQEQVRQLL